jgi:hypothetical protein
MFVTVKFSRSEPPGSRRALVMVVWTTFSPPGAVCTNSTSTPAGTPRAPALITSAERMTSAFAQRAVEVSLATRLGAFRATAPCTLVR